MERLSQPLRDTFAALSPAAQADLLEAMAPQRFGEGSYLFRQGEEPQGVWFLAEGAVNWARTCPAGLEHQLQQIGPGGGVGLVSLLDRKPYISSAKVLADATAWFLPFTAFDQLAQRHPGIALLLMRQLGEGVRFLVEHVHCTQPRSAQEKVVSVLLSRAEVGEDGQRVIKLTHQGIADLAKMARETVSRVLADLQRRGAVAQTRSRVILLDPARLWEQTG